MREDGRAGRGDGVTVLEVLGLLDDVAGEVLADEVREGEDFGGAGSGWDGRLVSNEGCG